MPRQLHKYIPNCLTAFRLIAVPTVTILILDEAFWGALFLFFLAAITDFLDGYLARKWQVTSTFGRIFDPIADKTIMACSYLALGYIELLPLWLVCLVISRDILILLVGAIVYLFSLSIPLTVLFSSKVNTFFQLLLVGPVLIASGAKGFPILSSLFQTITIALLWLTAVTTIWSGIDYIIYFTRKYRQRVGVQNHAF